MQPQQRHAASSEDRSGKPNQGDTEEVRPRLGPAVRRSVALGANSMADSLSIRLGGHVARARGARAFAPCTDFSRAAVSSTSQPRRTCRLCTLPRGFSRITNVSLSGLSPGNFYSIEGKKGTASRVHGRAKSHLRQLPLRAQRRQLQPPALGPFTSEV